MSIVMDTGSEWVKPLESTFLGLESGSCVAVNGGTIFLKVIQVWNDTT